MVSLNNLHELHGPAGQGECSGDVKTRICAQTFPLLCWSMRVCAPRTGTWVYMHQGQLQPVLLLLCTPPKQGDDG